jgi:translation initiation factor 3 subunit J
VLIPVLFISLQRQEEAQRQMTPEEKLAEKLRQQKMQEEADLKVARETFGTIIAPY